MNTFDTFGKLSVNKLSTSEITSLNQIPKIPSLRFQTGIDYFDDVLGGGLVEGSTLITAGIPGSGKSTLLIQVAYKLAGKGLKVLYIAGEENKKQIKIRAERLSINSDAVYLDEDTQVEKIILAVEALSPRIIIIDSMQMLYTDTLKQAPSSPTQMRYCLQTLSRIAKDQEITIIFVGHSTKSGIIAGAQSLQHMVDAVLWLSLNEDKTRTFQAQKNRFGSIEPVYTLYMTEQGLFDYSETKTPFGLIKTFNLTDIQIKEIASKSSWLRGFLIHFSLAWLKEQAKREANFKLTPIKSGLTQNHTFTLTSRTIENILARNPIMGMIIRPNLKYLEKYETK